MSVYVPPDPHGLVLCPRCMGTGSDWDLRWGACLLCAGHRTVGRRLHAYATSAAFRASLLMRRRAAAWFERRAEGTGRPPGCSGCGAIGSRDACYCAC